MIRILLRLIPAALVLTALCAGAQSNEPRELALMPMPMKVVLGTGSLVIDASFSVRTQGYSDQRLESAIQRIRARVSKQTGILFPPASAAPPQLIVECRSGSSPYPSLGENESYQLDISTVQARLQAETVTGVLRGLETFFQLIGPGADGFRAPAVHIEDQPRFPWRGLMIDASRHWMPLAVIERNLDAMAAVKLNVLHWHLSDDQGVRVESRKFPRLQEFASDGNFYSQADIRHIVEYARERGIRVIPEFDIPGHSTALLTAYPDLASVPANYKIERTWGIFQPTLDPSTEYTYTFLDAFIGEMTALFPDPYFHIGGDEIDDTQWKKSARIQAFAREHKLESSADIHAYFNGRVQNLLRKHGKIMIGWDEVLHEGLAPDTVIQSWRGQASLADAAHKGYRGVLSFGYYLDHLLPASTHYAVDPLDEAAAADPALASRILGGEACMWSEYVSPETVDSRIWPRMAAIAERFWSPREIKDVDSMYSRMQAVSRQLAWTGAQHRANYTTMLDRLAGGQTAEPVRVLADAVEALGIAGRRDERKYTSQVPLNRLVDAARPESERVRTLERSINRLLADPVSNQADLAEIRVTLTEWSASRSRLTPLAEGNFLVSELLPLSESLSTLGSMGLRALEYLQTGQTAPVSWVREQTQILDALQKPKAEVTLAAARPVRRLLEAASKTPVQSGAAGRTETDGRVLQKR
jgi:hexosaminidase